MVCNESRNSCYEAMISIQLILGGAIMLFENEGHTIRDKMETEELGRLTCAMDAIEQALHSAYDQASAYILHESIC